MQKCGTRARERRGERTSLRVRACGRGEAAQGTTTAPDMALDFAALLRAERQRVQQHANAAASSERQCAPRKADAAAPPSLDTLAAVPPLEPLQQHGSGVDAHQAAPPRLELSARVMRRLDGAHAQAQRGAPAIPRGVLYFRDFLGADDEEALRDRICHTAFASFWRQLRGRSLLNFGGTPTPDGIVPEPLPQFCVEVCAALVEAGIFPPDAPPNHVLVNRYKTGQGLMPHSDGPLYEPLVAIVSVGGPAMLDFWESLEHSVRGRAEHGAALPSASFACEPRSLLVFYDDAYKRFLHGIAERRADPLHAAVANAPSLPAEVRCRDPMPRGERISLTVRRVPPAGEASRPGVAFVPGPVVLAAGADTSGDEARSPRASGLGELKS